MSLKDNTSPLNNLHILLAEDNEVNIYVAKRFLEKWGATVDTARNGREVLDIFNKDRHQLILMDMHMPILTGAEATKRLRDQGCTVPIIALTASIIPDDQKNLKETGVTDVIIKPFEPVAFLDTLKRCVEMFSSNKLAS